MKILVWAALIVAAVILDLWLLVYWRRWYHWCWRRAEAVFAPCLLLKRRILVHIHRSGHMEKVVRLVKKIPAGAFLLLALAVSTASQFLLGKSESVAPSVFLLLILVPIVGLFRVVEKVREEQRAVEKTATGSEPAPAFLLNKITRQPWRAGLASLSLVFVILCTLLAREEKNNLAAGLAWLAGVGSFLAACRPLHWKLRWRGWMQKLLHQRMEWILILIVLAAGLFVLLYGLDSAPVEQDEGQFGYNALEYLNGKPLPLFLTASFVFHPAVFTILQACIMSVVGKTFLGFRLLSVMLGFLNLFFVILLVKRMLGLGQALVTGLLLAFAPYHFLFSRTGLNDIAVHAPFTITLYCLYRGAYSRRAIDFALAGVAFGLCLWVDYNKLSTMFMIILAGIFLYLHVVRWRPWRSIDPFLFIFIGGVAVVMIPVWVTYYSHGALFVTDHMGFIFKEANAQAAFWQYNTTNHLVVLANQIKYSLFGLNHYHDISPFFFIDDRRPMLCGITAVFFFFGLAYGLWRWKDPRYGMMLVFWVVGLQGSIWSTLPPLAHRLVLCMTPTYFFAAVGILKAGQTCAAVFKSRQRYVLIFLVSVILAAISYINLSACFSPKGFPLGWRETTKTGKVILAWSPDHDIYYLGAPLYYADGHGAIIFSSQLTSLSATNVLRIDHFVPLKEPATRDLAFIFSQPRFSDLLYVQKLYPRGELWQWYDNAWETTYLKAYLVSREDANHPVVQKP